MPRNSTANAEFADGCAAGSVSAHTSEIVNGKLDQIHCTQMYRVHSIKHAFLSSRHARMLQLASTALLYCSTLSRSIIAALHRLVRPSPARENPADTSSHGVDKAFQSTCDRLNNVREDAGRGPRFDAQMIVVGR